MLNSLRVCSLLFFCVWTHCNILNCRIHTVRASFLTKESLCRFCTHFSICIRYPTQYQLTGDCIPRQHKEPCLHLPYTVLPADSLPMLHSGFQTIPLMYIRI